ncbi:MAG: hypothetical protein ACPGNT_01670 [Rhodospirillales bacterium]
MFRSTSFARFPLSRRMGTGLMGACLIAAASMLSAPMLSAPAIAADDPVVAKVNGEEIKLSDVRSYQSLLGPEGANQPLEMVFVFTPMEITNGFVSIQQETSASARIARLSF